MEHLKYAWTIISENLVGWIIFGLVFSVAISFTGGLLFVLLPNAIRATRKGIASNAAPEVGELFDFAAISDDAIAMIGQGVANFVGGLLCGIGALATAPIFLFAPHVVSEGHYDGVSSLKTAMEHGKGNIVGHLIQMLIIGVILNIFMMFTLGFGALIATPLALVAFEHFYQEQRPHILAAAQAAQIPVKG
jgi:uncharacterized membrane protein